MLHCRWCGASFAEEDAWMLDTNESGFWCEDCQGFTFFNSEQDKRRMLLFLENQGQTEPPAPKTRLRKRVSPLRYPGGKSFLIDQVFAILVKEKLETFVEPFAGGASLGLSLLDAGVIQKLCINELDPLVYGFWKAVLEAPGYLLAGLKKMTPTLEMFAAAKSTVQQYREAPDDVPFDAAVWSFFVLNRTSFSGILSAGPLGGKEGGQEKLLSRWNPEELAKRILRVYELAPKIQLSNLDAMTFLSDEAWWNTRATIFLDPPYYLKGPVLYDTSFTEAQHQELAELLNSLYMEFPDPDIIITYDDVPEIRALYPYATIRNVERAYSIANGNRKKPCKF